MTRLSVIIPALNEEQHLPATLAQLQPGGAPEVIVVDGGSSDRTLEVARAAGCRVVQSAPGRGRQMNAGAAVGSGDFLLFLHADTQLPSGFPTMIEETLSADGVALGAFSLAIDQATTGLAILAALANLRSRYLRLPYGDQGLFVTRKNFTANGGYPEIEIMEDFVFVRRIARLGRIVTVPNRVVTSGRRWRHLGIVRTTLINQAIVAGYLLGVSPRRLAGWYRRLRGVGQG